MAPRVLPRRCPICRSALIEIRPIGTTDLAAACVSGCVLTPVEQQTLRAQLIPAALVA